MFGRVLLPLLETALGLTRPLVSRVLNAWLDFLDRAFGHHP